MVDRFEQEERYGPNSTIAKRTRFNQTIEPYRTNEVPEPTIGVKPHTVKELPALPVRERQQDNMLQHPNNMLQDDEVVHFGQRVQQPQDQQQLQLQEHNISHNPVYPKHFKGSIRVFVRDAHLFMIGKYVVIDRWFVSQIMGRGSIFINDPAPTDFQTGTSVQLQQEL